MAGIRRGRYPFRKARVSRRPTRFIRGTAPSAQSQGMQFVPRVLGNPLSFSERKYFDSEVVNRAIAITASTYANATVNPSTLNTCFAPTPGTGINQRIGRSVRVVSFKIRGELEIGAADDISSNLPMAPVNFRFIIAIDKQSNGAAPPSADLINSGNNFLAWNMFQNTASFGRFKVLKDKNFLIQDPNYGQDISGLDRNGRSIIFNYVFKFRRGLVVHFNAGSAGTIADITNNSINVFCGANNITTNPIINYKCRTCYYDS
ncbi:capsid [uncultured virus]|uniref:Capsid n=1 Tax=uncultured virus TaxID=340016 RepID=A0A2K9LT40_9VIRU|nr:capsid [uncultured virus]